MAGTVLSFHLLHSADLLFFTQTYAKSSTDKSNAEALLLVAFEQLFVENPAKQGDATAVLNALYEHEVVTDEDAIIEWCTNLESAVGLDVDKKDAKRFREAIKEFSDRFVDSDTDDDAED
jgi:trans-aconitate methyltransferase